MKPKILVTRQVFPEIVEALRSRFDVEHNDDDHPWPTEEVARRAADKQGVLASVMDRIDESVLAAAPGLKVVSNIAVGTNNIDIPACTKRGIRVTNTPGVLDDTTADLTFALLMAAARRIAEGDAQVRRGDWKLAFAMQSPLGTDVHHATLGIIGMGRIGQAIAKRATGFDMRVLYNNRGRIPEADEKRLNATWVERDRLFAESDFVVVMVPYSPAVHHLIGAAEIAKMKPTAILVNTAQGRRRGRRGARRGAEGTAHRRRGARRLRGRAEAARGLPRPPQRRTHPAHRQRHARHPDAHVRDGGRQPHGRARRARAAPPRQQGTRLTARRVRNGEQQMTAKVAFLGLGVMGFPMAGHLKARGYDVTVFNRTAAKSEAWVQKHGGQSAATPAEAARGADFVAMCVGNDRDLAEVAAAALDGMKKGAVLIDHTTASADAARGINEAARERGVDFIDAPVSGGQAGAENGKLTIMCGGDAGAVRAREAGDGLLRQGGARSWAPRAPASSPRWSTRSASPASCRASPRAWPSRRRRASTRCSCST